MSTTKIMILYLNTSFERELGKISGFFLFLIWIIIWLCQVILGAAGHLFWPRKNTLAMCGVI